jgi:REP element-mobilizing transposase RayT
MSTYSQVYLHIVFAVHNREPVIHNDWKEQLYKYIITIIQNHKHKVYAIGGIEDHVHILFSQNINHRVPDLMQEVKRDTSRWINQKKFTKYRFQWQEGYGVFSCNHSTSDKVVKYIKTKINTTTTKRLILN